MEEMGTVGRLFGALISKAGIPVPTEITQKVGLSRVRSAVAAAEYFAILRIFLRGLRVVNVKDA